MLAPDMQTETARVSITCGMQGSEWAARGQPGHASTADAVIAAQLLRLADVTKMLQDLSTQSHHQPARAWKQHYVGVMR